MEFDEEFLKNKASGVKDFTKEVLLQKYNDVCRSNARDRERSFERYHK